MNTKLFALASATILTAAASTAACAQDGNGGPGGSRPPAPAAGGVTTPAPASGASTVGEIVVTAQRTSERTSDVPIAIQAVGGQQLASRGVFDLSNLSQIAPSFTYSITGSQPTVALRGASGQVFGLAGDPSVAVSLDGVPYASQQYLAQGFLDVARLEVLRGPQGTVAGRNSTGGAINIISNLPTDTLTAAVNGTFGNYNERAADGYVSGPLIAGVLNARLAFRVNYHDGFLNNISPANPGLIGGDATERTARLSLSTASAGRFKALLTADIYRNDTTAAADRYEGTSNPNGEIIDANAFFSSGQIIPVLPTTQPLYGFNSLTVNQPFKEGGPVVNMASEGVMLRLQYDFGGGWNLTSTSGYRHYSVFDRLNVDGSLGTAFAGQQPEAAHQYSEEMTLTGNIARNLDALFGSLYLYQSGTVDLNVHYYSPSLIVRFKPGFTGFRVFDQQTLRSEAGFGQIRWRFLPKLQLTVGGRYTHDEKTFKETVYIPPPNNFAFDNASLGYPTPVSKDFYSFTPRIALDYKPSENITLYTSWAKGFKAGGFNVAALLANGAPNPFNPEKVSTYEVGAKTSWLDHTFVVNVDGFYSRFTDLQTQFTTPVGQQIENAATATVKGVELDVEAHPTRALALGFNGTYLDAAFDKFCPVNKARPDLFPTFPKLTAAQCGLPAGTTLAYGSQNMSGLPLPHAPKWSGTLTAAYTFDLSRGDQLIFDSAYNFSSRIFFTQYNELNVSQGSYGLLDLRATYRSPKRQWSVSAFVKNVTDTRYLTSANPNPIGLAQLTVPGDPRSLIAGVAILGVVGDPRTFGVTVGFQY